MIAWRLVASDNPLWLDIPQAVQLSIAAAAIVVGAVWTYFLFVKNRLGRPSTKITHEVETRDLGDLGLLVRVGVVIENTSSVLVIFKEADVRLTPMLPLDRRLREKLEAVGGGAYTPADQMKLEWPGPQCRDPDWGDQSVSKIAEPPHDKKDARQREIEPRESDTYYFDFVIPRTVATFQVYSYFKNYAKLRREVGWNTTSIHDVPALSELEAVTTEIGEGGA
jgi:hypothetical protein